MLKQQQPKTLLNKHEISENLLQNIRSLNPNFDDIVGMLKQTRNHW